jgi:fumarate reductase flavoprotein subunit
MNWKLIGGYTGQINLCLVAFLAGLAAAVAAAENGASVIVLEKRSALGGNSALAFGIFASESPVQKRAMIDCCRDDCFKLAMDFAHWKINPNIVRAFINKSGDTIRWLEEKGLEFNCTPMYPNQVPTWHIPRGRGTALMKVLAQNCKDLGVQLLTRTPAKKILVGSKGNITGVLAETKREGFIITAKSVIIATGGYGGNKNLLRKYCPDYRDNMECGGIGHAGDGLVMATQIGATTEGLGTLLMAGPIIPDNVSLKIGTPPNIFRLPLLIIVMEPYTIWVNKRGKRFIDEAFGYSHHESSNAVARQPESLSYTIFDGEMIQTMTEQGLVQGMNLLEGARGNKLPGLERALREQVDRGWVKISDSWDEIADWIGADPEALKTTIDEYNTACDRGHDPIFAKDRKYLLPLRTPPYYAIKCHVTFVNTIGGIKINEHMEVLNNQDIPIPGVYAAGVDTGGWESETYCERLSGSAFGFAVNSGRIAGENVAKFVSRNE